MNSIYRKPIHVLVQNFESETVLFNLQSEHYFSLDPIGSRMFELLTSVSSTDGVVEKILDEYDVDRERVEVDLKQLVSELLSRNLLES